MSYVEFDILLLFSLNLESDFSNLQVLLPIIIFRFPPEKTIPKV